MGKKTPLNAWHHAAKARMVDFAGWDMPVQYTSLLEEHRAVRADAGAFDVSHMLAVDVTGADSTAWLRYLLANDVAKITSPGKALYSCMLNAEGGVVDDLIVYHVGDARYRLVINAGNRESDLAWMQSTLGERDVTLQAQTDLAIIAVQGPNARDKALPLLPASLSEAARDLRRFYCTQAEGWFVGRTGYTGEDGFEVILPSADAERFWSGLMDAGVRAVGLGARDTLRLEAGMNLYGQDMDTTTNPLESGLAWTVALKSPERDFIGRAPTEALKQSGLRQHLVGLVLEDRGVLRGHQSVYLGEQRIGETTSGTFSPSLSQAIGLARIDASVTETCEVEIRQKRYPAKIVKPPFIKDGQATF
ncbi:MAG TPA: glycine cleavage system aminomethyltransferase GcvT [Gammaproteobacteria bacterium]|nr:glycine cleavage system aminomethyltransferase GcvT [Gammaproteobacteria bacterium]